VNSFEKNYRDEKPDCASVGALKMPELKGQAGIMKSYELAEKKLGRKI